jgi:hypothetical protein
MSRLVDLTGKSFARWTVIRRADRSPGGQTRWFCRCDCGGEAVVQGAALRTGHSRSCGCLKVETTTERSTKHGHAHAAGATPTYRSWAAMIARCTNPKHDAYPYYGGAGIKVCKRWFKFENFLADMGEKPKGLSIERKNGRRNYEPSNCIWATHTTQMRNTRRNVVIEIDGVSKTMAEWLESSGLVRATVKDRLAAGWSFDLALSTPAGTMSQNVRSRLITHQGQTLTLSEWSRRCGIPKPTIHKRLAKGWSVSRALSR